MRWIKKSIIVLLSAIAMILLISCNTLVSTPGNSLGSVTPTVTGIPASSTTQAATPTYSPTPSSQPSPSPSRPSSTPSASPSPSASPTPNPAEDKTFYIDRIISGYSQTPRPDGSFEKTPIYQDIYLDLNILGYYTKKDAIFVPRIPTFTDHDDWFIILKIPSYLLKPWIMNWGYTINKSSPTSSSATLSATVYTQELFYANYYLHPDQLLGYDLKGDREPSSSGILCKYFQTPGNYVILLRTNAADAIGDFWFKIGTEGNIITSTP